MSPAPPVSGCEGATGGGEVGAVAAPASKAALPDLGLGAGPLPGSTPSFATGREAADAGGTTVAGTGSGNGAVAPAPGAGDAPLPSLTLNDAGKSSRTTTPEIGQSVRLVTLSS